MSHSDKELKNSVLVSAEAHIDAGFAVRHPLSFERILPLGNRHDVRLPRKYFLYEYSMHLWISIQARIGEHRQPIILVSGLAQGR